MKNDEATVSAKKTAILCARAGAVAALLVLAGLLPLPLDAAIDHEDAAASGTTVVIATAFPPVAIDNEDTLDADDRLPVLAQDISQGPDAPVSSDARAIDVRPPEVAPSDAEPASKNPDQSLWPPKELGIADRVQDWLARANREFQSTIIRRLSTPSAVAGDAAARKIEEVEVESKAEDAASVAAAAQEAISAAQAKLAAEAEAKHQQELSDAAAKAAEEAKARDAEAARIDAERKAADEKRLAEEQRRRDQLRVAEEEKAAKQKAAEEAAAREAAAKAVAAAREIAERRAAEAAAAKRAAEAKEAEAKQQALREAEAAKAAAEAKAAQEAKAAEEAKAAQEAKLAEEAKRKADEEAAKAAAAQEAEAKAKIVAANEAAEKERAARDAATKDAEAKRQASGSTQHAMVEDTEKDETDVAEAPSAAEQPSVNALPPEKRAEDKSSGDSETAIRKPRRSHARVHEQASNRSAHHRANQSARAGGPVVKPWIRRARQGRCRFAGHKVLLPGRYTVARGDNLWLIALRHYHDGWFFRRIYRANRDIIRNPNRIYPCERLYLPQK